MCRLASTVQKTENGWNEDQRGYGSQKQTPNDRAAKRSILFSTLTSAQRHRHHANNHCKGGHTDGTKSWGAGFHGCQHSIAMVSQALLREGEDQDAVRRRYSHTHNRAHQSRHAQRGASREKEQDNAGKRCGKCRDDDEGVEPRLEVNHHQQVNKSNRKRKTGNQANVGGLHCLNLSANSHEGSAGNRLLVVGDDLIDRLTDSSKIAALHRSVDIKHSPNVVMIDHLHLTASADIRYVREDRRLPGGG